jgi:hypothetical protein
LARRAVPPEEILEGHTPEVKAVANRLRDMVKKTVEGAQESGYPGWHAIGYRHPAVGYFCGIFPSKDRVKLFFEYGSTLPDPKKILLGGPKMRGRYLEFNSVQDIDEKATRKFLLDATVMKGL